MRVYTVSYKGTLAVAGTDSDLFELVPAAEKPICLLGLVLAQSTDFKDAEEEGLQIDILRVPATFTSGSGGSAVTPVPTDDLDVAASFAAECNNTTLASTSASLVTLESFAWNVRVVPMERWWAEEFTRFKVRRSAGNAQGLVVRCNTTPADNIDIAITAFVGEW